MICNASGEGEQQSAEGTEASNSKQKKAQLSTDWMKLWRNTVTTSSADTILQNGFFFQQMQKTKRSLKGSYPKPTK